MAGFRCCTRCSSVIREHHTVFAFVRAGGVVDTHKQCQRQPVSISWFLVAPRQHLGSVLACRDVFLGEAARLDECPDFCGSFVVAHVRGFDCDHARRPVCCGFSDPLPHRLFVQGRVVKRHQSPVEGHSDCVANDGGFKLWRNRRIKTTKPDGFQRG